MMSKFSPLKFLETFTKGKLSVDIRSSRLKSGNNHYDKIVDAFEEIVDLVNSQGGWTVYVWDKIGLIRDVSILGNDIKEPGDNKVPSQEISTHAVHLHPSNKYYLDISTIQGGCFDNLKFYFSTI